MLSRQQDKQAEQFRFFLQLKPDSLPGTKEQYDPLSRNPSMKYGMNSSASIEGLLESVNTLDLPA